MSNRALTYGAGLVAVAGGYYLYQAGGSPKAAEKRFEREYHLLSSCSIADRL